MEELSKELVIKIKNKSYPISFPNNGQLIDIETRKVRMSNGTTDKLLHGST